MFEIGCRAIYERDIKEAIRVAKRGGFRVLEIHLSSPQFFSEKYSRRQLQALKQYTQKMGVVLQVHGSLETSLIYTNPDLRAGAKRQMDRIVSFCVALGARCLTLHPGQAAIYHTADGKKLKGDSVYTHFYELLFEDSIKYLESIARKDLYICIENTDNFTAGYRKTLSRCLKRGKIFLTWDIRKNYSYGNGALLVDQWEFVTAHRQYVKNLHVSGLGAAHGALTGFEKKLMPFFRLFGGRGLPLIVEIMPEKQAGAAKTILDRLSEKFRSEYYRTTKSYWNQRSERYFREEKPKVVKTIIAALKLGAAERILDIGSGPAHYAIDVGRETGARMTCLDFSDCMVNRAKQNARREGLAKQFSFIQGNIINVRLPSASFDAVLAVSVLHHLLPDDIAAVLRAIHRTLRPGGRLVIVEYWAASNGKTGQALHLAEQDRARAGFIASLLSDRDYINLLEQAGFSNIRIKHVTDKVFTGKYLSRTGRKGGSSARAIISVFLAFK